MVLDMHYLHGCCTEKRSRRNEGMKNAAAEPRPAEKKTKRNMGGTVNTRLESAVRRMSARIAKGRVMDVKRTYLPMIEATKYMGCTRYMLMGLRDSGMLRCSKIGKMLYFSVEDMDKLFEDNIINNAAYKAR